MKKSRNAHIISMFLSLLLVSGLFLAACSAPAESESPESEASSSSQEAIAVSGEMIDAVNCRVLLPDGWEFSESTTIARFSVLSNGDKNNPITIEISLDMALSTDEDLQERMEHLKVMKHGDYENATQGEMVEIAGIAFYTIELAVRPQINLYGLREIGNSGMKNSLDIMVMGMSLDDPILAAVISSIEHLRPKPAEEKDQEPEQTPQVDPISYIEEGLPLTIASNGREYTIDDIYWGGNYEYGNGREDAGLVLKSQQFSPEDVYPFMCEIESGGTVMRPDAVVNTIQRVVFTFNYQIAYVNENTKPEKVRIWAVDNPGEVYEFVLK